MFFFVFLMLLSHSTSVTSTRYNLSCYDNAKKPKSIFILAGQNNMAGRGGIVSGVFDGFVPRECRSNPQILRPNADLTWENAREPLHSDIDVTKPCGVGPGMPFSNFILESCDPTISVIGLVPCAIGGTKITEWHCGGELYNRILSRQAAVQGGGGLIRAILWYQGESGTTNIKDAKGYRMRLERFFTDIRLDLLSPFLPVIQVALASGLGNFTKEIREAQLEMELPNVKCVDATGLPLLSDKLHLTTQAQVELGKMMACLLFNEFFL